MAVNATHRAHSQVNVCYSKSAPVNLQKVFFCLRGPTAGEREKDYQALSRWRGLMQEETTGGRVKLRHGGDTGTHRPMVKETARNRAQS